MKRWKSLSRPWMRFFRVYLRDSIRAWPYLYLCYRRKRWTVGCIVLFDGTMHLRNKGMEDEDR